MAESPLPEITPRDVEELQVDTWLVRRFLELGFSRIDASLLAGARADWHATRTLLEEGCSHTLAVRIAL